MGMGESYRAFGVEPPAAYFEACGLLSSALIACEPYERPAAKVVGRAADNAFRGAFVVKGEDGVARGRLLHEHYDKVEHMREAAGARPSTRTERSGYSC